MKNALKPIGIIVALLFVFFLLIMNTEEGPINWTPTFKTKDKIPFGTYVLHSELSSNDDIFEFSDKQNLNAFITNYFDEYYDLDSLERLKQPLFNVILIENEMENLNYYEVENILDFIEIGHTVFFSSLKMPNYLVEKVDSNNALMDDLIVDSVQIKSTEFPNTLYPKGKIKQKFIYAINAHKIYEYCTDNYSNPEPNFIEYRIGKGQLLLHTFPYAFTNYYMLDSNTQYREKVQTIVNRFPNKKLIWVKSSKPGFKRDSDEKNILSIIMAHPPLNMAWKLIIIGLLFYSLFKIKREQRIIPVIEPFKNKTKEFIQVVSQVHISEQNFTSLAQKKYIYIIDFLRKTHYIDMNNTPSFLEDTIITKTKLSKKETILFLKYISQNKNKQQFTEVQFLEFCKLSDKIENII